MGFFSKDGKKGESERLAKVPSSESQRLKAEAAPPPPPPPTPRKVAIRTFVLGLAPSEKLSVVPDGKFEEGLRDALPAGTHVARLGHEGNVRQFEVGLGSGEDMIDVLTRLLEHGILSEVKLALHHCAVVCRADGVSAPVAFAAEPTERAGTRITIRSTSRDVQVQYPPLEIHKRWQGDEDYRDAFNRWRAQRTAGAGGRWYGAWPDAGGPEETPWIKLSEAQSGEYAPDFDDAVLLRFAFQGAETAIMRFNLRVLLNTVTAETAVYRGLPISLESIPRDLLERMNREAERFARLREPGGFASNYDLIRQLYEEAGGDYFHLESPHSPEPAPAPEPRGRAPAPAVRAASGMVPRPTQRPAPTPKVQGFGRPSVPPKPVASAPAPAPEQATSTTATEESVGEGPG